MPETIREVMTANPVALQADMTVLDAARRMRDENIGDVLVRDGDELCGIVTDRDIVLRMVADDKSPKKTRLKQMCSNDLVTASPDESVSNVIQLMRAHAVRRIPVVENGRAIGIVSLGDLAIARDRESALGEISASPAN